ncbi:MAG: TIGR03885 family FMN-dependent LLM class oxidoreductase [Arthrobacter sp.]|uniref:TIGR03885 family FMN-dependent LLM class oxidoreductase n=1 Tax=Arthrobacter sp. TaxID=1667 RepID=UPI0034851BEB
MALIGFHASHEQAGPAQLLNDVRHAEAAGFQAAMCSDHFNPWTSRQGHSAHTWAWLGSALATTGLRFGTVTAPGQRYHPAILAQAAATLATMYPGRLWMATGTGENLNESITGEPWPPKDVRNQRLAESVDVMRRLFAGERVTHRGAIHVEDARLWDRPEEAPRILAPAVSTETAAWSAGWAEGLITVNQTEDKLRRVVDAYRDAGGAGPLALQLHLCWAPAESEAERIAHEQWAGNTVSPPVTWDLPTPEHFEAIAARTSPQEVRGSVVVSSDLAELTDRVAGLAALGFDEVYLHHVGQEQTAFIDAFGDHVLPHLAEAP